MPRKRSSRIRDQKNKLEQPDVFEHQDVQQTKLQEPQVVQSKEKQQEKQNAQNKSKLTQKLNGDGEKYANNRAEIESSSHIRAKYIQASMAKFLEFIRLYVKIVWKQHFVEFAILFYVTLYRRFK